MFKARLSYVDTTRPVLLAALIMISCAVSPAASSDVRFASGGAALSIPFRLYNNHIYLQVGVNGSGPLWFLLDTGAVNIINARHAQALGLRLTQAGRAAGVGEGSVEVSRAEGVSYALPGVTVSRQKFAVLSLENVEGCSDRVEADSSGGVTLRRQALSGAERQPLDGVLGDEFFRLFVVEIDYAARSINLHEPRGYRYGGRGEVVPLEVRQRYAFVRAAIKPPKGPPAAGLFMVDSGAVNALTLSRPFVERNGLLPPADRTTPFELCGIGGGSAARIGSLDSLRLGGFTVEKPVTIFSQAGEGVLAGSDFDGLIGGAILRRFHVVFDYTRGRMILEGPAQSRE